MGLKELSQLVGKRAWGGAAVGLAEVGNPSVRRQEPRGKECSEEPSWAWKMIMLEHKVQPEGAKRLDATPSSNNSFVLGRLFPHSVFQFLNLMPRYSHLASYPTN